MMARSKAKPIARRYWRAERQSQRPGKPRPFGLTRNAASAAPVSSARSVNYDLRRPSCIHPHFASTRSTWELFRGSFCQSLVENLDPMPHRRARAGCEMRQAADIGGGDLRRAAGFERAQLIGL